MTRPSSHREQQHPKRCGNCAFSRLLAYKLDLLCFHGDVVITDVDEGGEVFVYDIKHNCINLMDGEDYDKVWGGCAVDPEMDVCDEWKSGRKP